MTREDTVLAMSQALSAVDIYRNEERARHVLTQFLARFRAELTSQETKFLQKLMER